MQFEAQGCRRLKDWRRRSRTQQPVSWSRSESKRHRCASGRNSRPAAQAEPAAAPRRRSAWRADDRGCDHRRRAQKPGLAVGLAAWTLGGGVIFFGTGASLPAAAGFTAAALGAAASRSERRAPRGRHAWLKHAGCAVKTRLTINFWRYFSRSIRAMAPAGTAADLASSRWMIEGERPRAGSFGRIRTSGSGGCPDRRRAARPRPRSHSRAAQPSRAAGVVGWSARRPSRSAAGHKTKSSRSRSAMAG